MDPSVMEERYADDRWLGKSLRRARVLDEE